MTGANVKHQITGANDKHQVTQCCLEALCIAHRVQGKATVVSAHQ
jgi:hypothetical protein